MTLTHRQLCDLAVNWLKRPASRSGPGCQVAFSECRGDWNGEMPDAIGFRAAVFKECSVLVEVKTSRSDFLQDRRKPHRLEPSTGMGVYRYFMAPAGLISVNELPDRWGLIEVNSKSAPKVVAGHVLLKYGQDDVWQHERAIEHEWTLLTRMLNRVGDVEKAQNILKESRNINARLVRENDRLRERADQLTRELHAVRYAGVAGADHETPQRRARPKQDVAGIVATATPVVTI